MIIKYSFTIDELRSFLEETKNRNHLESLTVCKFPDNGRVVLHDNYGYIGPLFPNTGTKFDKVHPESDWIHSESYHAHYDEENNALVIFVNIGKYSKLSNK